MNGKQAGDILRHDQQYLHNIIKGFQPEHADFRPVEGVMTVVQQIRHIAISMEWFKKGAFAGPFDMNFEAHHAEIARPCTLKDAIAELDRTYDDFVAFLEPLGEADLARPMADNPIFGPLPRLVIFHANTDHTAHHRGALSVYLRMLGITPTMVYS